MKWTLPVLIAGFAGITLLFGIFIRECQTTFLTGHHGKEIGYSLLQGKHPEEIRHLGQNTIIAIQNITNMSPQVLVSKGDAKEPIGNGSADYQIHFTISNLPVLNLRIRIDGETHHILGFYK